MLINEKLENNNPVWQDRLDDNIARPGMIQKIQVTVKELQYVYLYGDKLSFLQCS